MAHEFKVVMLGEGRVGKTSLTLKFVEDRFDEGQESTINANFLTKKITVGGKTGTFNIWDTAGQEKFRALVRIYYRSAMGAIIVYDITDRSSFERVVAWVKELRKMAEPGISIVIAGNKCDLEAERKIGVEEAVRYAESVGAAHFNTSAKSGQGVKELYDELAKQVMKHLTANSIPQSKARGVQILASPQGSKANNKNRCC